MGAGPLPGLVEVCGLVLSCGATPLGAPSGLLFGRISIGPDQPSKTAMPFHARASAVASAKAEAGR